LAVSLADVLRQVGDHRGVVINAGSSQNMQSCRRCVNCSISEHYVILTAGGLFQRGGEISGVDKSKPKGDVTG